MKCLNTECRQNIYDDNCSRGYRDPHCGFIPEAEKPSPPSVDSQSAGSVPECQTCDGSGFVNGRCQTRQTLLKVKCKDCAGPHWAMLKGGGNIFEEKEPNAGHEGRGD